MGTFRDRRQLIADAAAGTGLVVLPELWATGYFSFDRYSSEAEPLEGPTITTLQQAASRHHVHLMAGTFIERKGTQLTNCAVTIGPDGRIIHIYRKIHLFGYKSQEFRLLTAGTEAPIVATAIGRFGTTTCYDLRFPELYRLMVGGGAQLVIIPAAWPATRLEHWRVLLRARAIENQVFVVACNGTGSQRGVRLGGPGMVVGPWGDVTAEAGDQEQVLRAEIDLGEVDRVRSEFPVLEHRRITTAWPTDALKDRETLT